MDFGLLAGLGFHPTFITLLSGRGKLVTSLRFSFFSCKPGMLPLNFARSSLDHMLPLCEMQESHISIWGFCTSGGNIHKEPDHQHYHKQALLVGYMAVTQMPALFSVLYAN